jgi:rhamnulokinase
MQRNHFLAFDLGASSGRAILGTLDNGKLHLTEIHRFKNQMLRLHGTYYWNIFSLFEELKTGLKKCISEFGIQPESIGIDTWGVDYALVAKEGMLVGLPYAYRDHRTDHSMEEFFRILPQKETYLLSGIQFMQFNTLFQLFASVQSDYSGLKHAESLLFTPDALNYLFTGVKKNEYTIASTSQLLKPGKPEWESELFKAAGIPQNIVCDLVLPGTIIGELTREIMEDTGSSPIPCIAVASHDTASAIASVPAEGENWAYISSGTWSLMGIESKVPLVSEETLELNFTNEGGVDGTTRYLKNIMGLWLIQECKRIWDLEKVISWDEIVDLSTKAVPFRSLIDPDHPSFLNPGNMPEAISAFCRKTGQPVPITISEISRCIYDSLALRYKYTLEIIESVSSEKVEVLHVIGGGANNSFLCQLTADATGLTVAAGPVEATAIGNLLVQARALGYINSLIEIRKVVRDSFPLVYYHPDTTVDWNSSYARFRLILDLKPE